MIKTAVFVGCAIFCSAVLADEPAISLTQTQSPVALYRLFPTSNMYTFLKLNTETGAITRIQWGFDQAHTFEVRLCGGCNQTAEAPHARPGRFTLYPTENFYTFILVDQATGQTWEVAWSTGGNGSVNPIHEIPASDLKQGQ